MTHIHVEEYSWNPAKSRRNIMISQVQGVLSNSVGAILGAGSTARTLAGAHPIGLGIVVGISAYFVVDKYWLNKGNEGEHEEVAEEETTETAA